jgi:hypothetical protein
MITRKTPVTQGMSALSQKKYLKRKEILALSNQLHQE